MIFTKSSDIPAGVNSELENIANFSAGMSIQDIVGEISQRLRKILAAGSQVDPVNVDDNSDVEMIDSMDGVNAESEEQSDDEYDEDYGYGLDDFGDDMVGKGAISATTYHISPEAAAKLNKRIREDLLTVRFSGFKLGILSGLKAESQTCVLSISIQASKFGLSEEALQAWDLEPQQYIVLLLRYASGYKTFEAVISEPAKSLDITFRIGVSNRYKPTLVEALAAFTDIIKDGGKQTNKDGESGTGTTSTAGFSSLFISSSLNDFINEQFISLLKIRNATKIGWDGAKRFFNDKQGRVGDATADLPYYHQEFAPKQTSLPEIALADHLLDTQVKNPSLPAAEDKAAKKLSLPLIAAQFSMRYLLRCTEFCLVCHDRIEGDFEALKPYVCDKPLCLYQYMSLGFGPSVEHEILTQPYVVDLLVSFCYTAAKVRFSIDVRTRC